MTKRDIIISITGHRKFPNIEKEKELFMQRVQSWFDDNIDHAHAMAYGSVTLIHGCALGVDTWFGEYCLNRGYNLELHLPFPADVQEVRAKMSPNQKAELRRQMRLAQRIIVVNEKYFSYGYQKRNMSLVDHSDLLLGYYSRSRSGSANCARYYNEVKSKDAFNLKTGKLCEYEFK